MTVEELTAAGMRRMDEDEIDGFLCSQGVGMLGLADGPVPYLLPMSFGYDGEDSLYFTYVLGGSSRKQTLTEQRDRAAFLVFEAPSTFQWQSVRLTGTLEGVPPGRWDDIAGVDRNAWRPDIFDDTDESTDVCVYRFTIEDRVGLKHTGLPPGFERTGRE